MPVASALNVAIQLIGLVGPNIPAAIKAVQDFKALFDGGNEPTQADVDALIDKVKAQGETIKNL